MTPYYQDDHVTIYHGDCRPEPIPWKGSQTWQRATPELIERVTPYLESEAA